MIADRFELRQVAGTGGMGTVYQALDRQTGRLVAVKLLHQTDGSAHTAERFVREARVLAQLQYRSIVSYVAHGQAAERQLYLAMEWLEGEDLASRLRRSPLSFRATLATAQGVAEALEFAHESGVIHRDIKPANIFLCAQTGAVKLLDFGIAHWASSQALTRTGTVVGTMEYMAPEQAQGRIQITPKADIYSLGCVLYECLTGQPPFVAEHPAAILAKVLFAELVPLVQRRPDLPTQLSDLVGRMLDKEPDRRPAQVSAGLREMIAYAPSRSSSISGSLQLMEPVAMSRSEERLVGAILACPRILASPVDDEALGSDETVAQTSDVHDLPLAAKQLGGAKVTWLSQGSLLAVFERVGIDNELLQAARLASELARSWPNSQVALAVCRREATEALAVGSLVEICSRMLAVARDDAGWPIAGVWLDETSASLLDFRFAVDKTKVGSRLGVERDLLDEPRLFYGRPMPCVGRDAELAMIDLHLQSCLDDQTCRGVLVLAPPGFGKSHLQREFRTRLQRRGQPFTLLLGRGDKLTDSSPYDALRQALRMLCGAQVDMDAQRQQAQLRERIGRHRERPPDGVVEFLGELTGSPFSSGISPQVAAQLRAARNDPKLMSEQIGRALIAFLAAECRVQPVLMVLEDLQWFDPLSVALIDEVLMALAGQPLFALALARPEVNERFPKLWAGRKFDTIALRGLGKKSCERLAAQLIGSSVTPSRITRIIEQSEGNPLLLEELMRAALSGGGNALPASVLALLEQRVAVLSTDARRVLRAASIFGETFWLAGVRALCALPDQKLSQLLNSLIDADLIELHRQSRFVDDREYIFNHTLMREAVYQMLTPADRKVGHQLAAQFLTKAGEQDPFLLACHYENGGEPQQAAAAFVTAAEQSLLSYDMSKGLQLATRALALVPDDGAAQALLQFCSGAALRCMAAEPWQAMSMLRQAHEWFQRAGDVRHAVISGCLLGLAQREVGDATTGEQTLRAALDKTSRISGTLLPVAQLHLAMFLAQQEDAAAHRECESLARAVADDFAVSPVYVAVARALVARSLLWQGKAEEAADLAQRASEALVATPFIQAAVLPTLIDCTRAASRVDDAAALAGRAITLLDQHQEMGYLEPLIRLAAADAYSQAGQLEQALTQRAAAFERVMRIAAGAPDAAAQARFLRAVPENARAVAAHDNPPS